jgi:type IV fimbrial biogenesis protein FimT
MAGNQVKNSGGLSQSGGFSLTELMTVVAILGVMLLVGVPGMLNLIRDARLSAQTDQFIGFLSEARMAAVKQRINFTVCPAADADTASACSTAASDWSKGALIWNGTAVVRRLVFPEGMTIAYAQTAIVFTETLGGATSAATITLCVAGRKQQAIQVTASGRISKKINSSVTCA